MQARGAMGTRLASAEAGARPPGRPMAGRALLCGSVPRPAPRACVASPGSQRAQRDRASDFRARPVRDPSQSSRRPVTAWWKDTLAWRHGCPPGGRGCLDEAAFAGVEGRAVHWAGKSEPGPGPGVGAGVTLGSVVHAATSSGCPSPPGSGWESAGVGGYLFEALISVESSLEVTGLWEGLLPAV